MKYPVDDKIASHLQDLVRRGDRGALTALYCEARYIATILCKTILRRRKERMSTEQIAMIAHDAATVLMIRYLKDRAYRVRNFRAVLYLEVLNLVTGGHRKTVKHSEIAESDIPEKRESAAADPRDYLHDLLSEHQAGPRVVYDLARSKSYREAVHRIAEYTGRRWIRDRARKLIRVYETLRVKP